MPVLRRKNKKLFNDSEKNVILNLISKTIQKKETGCINRTLKQPNNNTTINDLKRGEIYQQCAQSGNVANFTQ